MEIPCCLNEQIPWTSAYIRLVHSIEIFAESNSQPPPACTTDTIASQNQLSPTADYTTEKLESKGDGNGKFVLNFVIATRL